jgi:hypothetical protein
MDGVLLPFGASSATLTDGALFPDAPLAALSVLVEAVPQAEIVLSSTWRVQDSYIRMIEDDWRRYAAAQIRTARVDDTPLTTSTTRLATLEIVDRTDPALHSQRSAEIYDWIRRHTANNSNSPIAAWLAVDDEDLYAEEDDSGVPRHVWDGHFINTQSHVGLTRADATTGVALLWAQLEEGRQP